MVRLTVTPDLASVPGDSTHASLPRAFALAACEPNPSTGAARIGFALPRDTRVRLDVLDLQGRRVRVLVDAALPAGEHVAVWDGRDAAGAPAGPGVYFYRMQAGGFTARRRLVRVR